MSDHTHDPAAERALLGVILSGAPVLDDVADVLRGEDFYQPRHEQVYDAALVVHRRGDRVDPVLVSAALGGAVVQRMGGGGFLADLLGAATVGGSAMKYARIVAEKALLRRLREVGEQITARADAAGDALAIAEDSRAAVETAAQSAHTEQRGSLVADLLAERVDELEHDVEPGLRTGWTDLDDVVGGLLPGQLIVVGARPSVGKSVVGTNLAATAASQGVPTYLLSLEMPKREVMNRLLSAAATVNLSHLMHHKLSDDDWQRIGTKAQAIQGWPLIVDDDHADMHQLRARARSARRRMGGLGLVVVDYLQLVDPHDPRAPREQQVSYVSRMSKRLGKELACPVVLLAQVNRQSAGSGGPPTMAQLRESGAIEQDADGVWLLHRPDMDDPESDRMGELDLIVDKNRNGVRRPVTLLFQGHYSRVVSMQT